MVHIAPVEGEVRWKPICEPTLAIVQYDDIPFLDFVDLAGAMNRVSLEPLRHLVSIDVSFWLLW